MVAPTLAELRVRSAILRAAYPSPAGDAALTVLRDDADALVSAITGRDVGMGAGEEVPAALVPIARRAVTHEAEQLDSETAERRAEMITAAAGGLASISAGPWQESYFAPGASRTELSALSPDPVLAQELWLLLTDDKRAQLLNLLDPNRPLPPAYAVEEVDWFPEGAGTIWPRRTGWW